MTSQRKSPLFLIEEALFINRMEALCDASCAKLVINIEPQP